MVYTGIYNGECITFSDWPSAERGASELGLTYFFPRESVFSNFEEPLIALVLEHGKWTVRKVDDMECTCGKC
jgi:hypothetical protein